MTTKEHFHRLMTQTAVHEVAGRCFSVQCLKNCHGGHCCGKANWSLLLFALQITQSTENDASKTGRLNLHT